MAARARRRRGARKCARHPAFFESNTHQGAATLCEISYSGARIEVTQDVPTRGEPVRVFVWPPNQSEPFELAGHVVARRGATFAMEFHRAGQALCQWIDGLHAAFDAAAEATPERVVEG